VNEGTVLTFSDGNGNPIRVSDVDVAETPGGTLTTTVSVEHGTLTATATPGAIVTSNGTASVTISGMADEVNAALAGLSYRHASNYTGADTLTILTNDNGNTGIGGPLTDTKTIRINIIPTIVSNLPTDGTPRSTTGQQINPPPALEGTTTFPPAPTGSDSASLEFQTWEEMQRQTDYLGFDSEWSGPGSVLVILGDTSLVGEYGIYLAKTPSSQEVLVDETATFNLPSGMFKHSDSNAKVKVEATLADGRSLPDWIKFDPASGRFTVTPPEGSGGAMDIKVTARDEKGNVVATQFLLHITESKSTSSAITDPPDEMSDMGDHKSDQGSVEKPADLYANILKEPTLFYNTDVRNIRGRPSLTEQIALNGIKERSRDFVGLFQ
jgi:hypothetical protein